MDWTAILYPIIGTVLVGLGGVGIKAIFAYAKKLDFIKALQIEELLDSLAESAINYAESLGRNLQNTGTEKMEAARKAFEADLERHKVKLPPDLVEKRLESVFNRVKPLLEQNQPDKSEGKKAGDDTAILPAGGAN